jgi:hypothetical protein
MSQTCVAALKWCGAMCLFEQAAHRQPAAWCWAVQWPVRSCNTVCLLLTQCSSLGACGRLVLAGQRIPFAAARCNCLPGAAGQHRGC